MESVDIHRLGSNDFTWAEQIAAELASDGPRKAPFVSESNTATNSQDVFVLDHRNVTEVDPLPGSRRLTTFHPQTFWEGL